MKFVACSFLVVAAALPLFAQSSDTPAGQPAERVAPPVAEPPRQSPFRSFIELQYHNYGNFYQAPGGQPERSVNALGAGYRVVWTRPGNNPDLYGRISTVRYSGGASDTSYTGQVGLMKYGSVHWYDFSLDHTRNGYSFDLEETRATANITSLWGHYSMSVAEDWRIGAETYNDWQRFNVDTGLESDYYSLSGVVRYSGFGDIFKPRAGYTVGRRTSRDQQSDLDDRYWFIQLGTEPIQDLEFSLRYRGRTTDYDNIARKDDRSTWQFRASWRQNEHLNWVATWRSEAVDTTRVNRDFERNTASLMMTYGF